MQLSGKKVLITGASEGIGRSLAVQFSEAGAQVVASARNDEALKQLTQEFPKILPRRCDVTVLSEIAELFTWLLSELGGLDIIVNNAGIWQKEGGLESIDDLIIERLVNTNLLGTIFCTKAALPYLKKAQEAAVVNIISHSGVEAQKGQSVYTATKYGVRGFTDVLRQDLKGSNVHIMAVYQSGTHTEMFAKAGEDFDVGKFTEPDDLARAIVAQVGGPAKFWVPELHVNYR